MSTYVKNDFTISSNKKYLDVELIYNYLHDEAYWSKGIPLRLVEKSIQHSICFGVFAGNPEKEKSKQLGLGRIITDSSTFAYLADVFILNEFRGLGLGKLLVQTMINCPSIREERYEGFC
ncbi:GNAT family N-acetyltransferase [Priestia aryabhattai]|uniref:GNAT family N-acetyltransferase n=1 Tax=Priestia aryabhattai TaxID=412384 RepID=UPI00209B0905|nr:GNAT family N-acetyltransferase [Priestia aryabhattai]